MRNRMIGVLCACLCLSVFVSAHEHDHAHQAVRVADFVSQDIQLDTVRGEISEVIRAPGASFIKVHFDWFNLPDSAYVEVRNPRGTEVYRYGMSDRDDFTYDEALGEDGYNSFASMSITGDQAIVTVYSALPFSWEDGYGVYIGRYMEGYPNGVIEELIGEPLEGPISSSTCGAMQRTPVECYSSSHPTEYERAKSVARLLMSGSLCTAWRAGDDNRLFTNNHCMSTASAVSGSESWFNYQYSSCSSSSTTTATKVSGNSMLMTNYNYDVTLYTVNNFSSIQGFGNLGLDVRTPSLHEEIYIPQHGSGNPKELSIEDDQNATGICRIDDAIANGRVANSDTGYYCDTIGGSSGSPVLARSSHKAIALHHYGGCTNQGVRIDLIWPLVSSYFGGVIPDGSGGGGNPPGGWTTITSDDFESGWGNFNDGGSDCRRSANDSAFAHQGTYCVRLRDNTSTSVATSDPLNLSGYSEAKVDFWFIANSMETGEDFWLQVSTNGGSSYSTVASWARGTDFNNGSFSAESVSIPTNTTHVRFRCDASGNNDRIYIDEVVVSAR